MSWLNKIIIFLIYCSVVFAGVSVTSDFEPKNNAFDILVQFENIGTTNGANYSLYYGLDSSGANLSQNILNEILIGSIGDFLKVNADATGYEWSDILSATPGTVAANKVVVVDGDKDIGTFCNITMNGTLTITNSLITGDDSIILTPGSGDVIIDEGDLVVDGGDLRMNGGNLSSVGTIGASGDADLLSLASGALTVNGTIGSGAITSTGTVQGSSLTDGTMSVSSGAFTNVASIVVDNITLNGNDISVAGALNIVTSGAINLAPSSDVAAFIEITTVGGVPQISTTGASNLKIMSSGGTIDFDDENLTTTGAVQGSSLTDGTTTISGGNITSAVAINLKPSGDNDDYLSFLTVGDVPTIGIIGGDFFNITSASGSSSIHFFEDINRFMSIGWSVGGGTGFVISTENLLIQTADNNGNITLSPHGTGEVIIDGTFTDGTMSISGGNFTGVGDITFDNGEAISNSVNNQLSFTGASTGGETTAFIIDYDDTELGPTLRGTTTQSGTKRIFFDSQLRLNDDVLFNFGDAADVFMRWETTNNDHFIFGTAGGGSASKTNNFVFYDPFTLVNPNFPTETQVTVRIQARTNTLEDYISFAHDGTDAIIDAGSGTVKILGDGLTVDSDSIRIISDQSPASNGTGTQGEIAWDAEYIYICIATDTWGRVALEVGY